jgi:hypothetical protein
MNYTVISNMPIRGASPLSGMALAFLVYLYSQPDNWRVSHQDLMRRFHVGRDKAYAILGELIQTGYITKHALRAPTGRIIGHEYVVDDEPQSDQWASVG